MAMSYSSNCCATLASCPSLHSLIAFPNTTSYNTTLLAYWSLQESSLLPSCIVQPTTSAQVSDALSFLTANPACENTDFAIKAQGHAPAAGFANIGPGGVTIDITGLDAISVNADHSIACVGAGASWVDVYAYLDPLHRTVAGGRNGLVGVGGLTLGGGISYFSPQVGFTCDTVVNFEVALPSSGKLANVNATSHPDLFRALKGGGNNFGIVTRFDFSTIPVGEILGGSIGNNITSREAVFQAFANIAGAADYDVHASVVAGLTFNSSSKQWGLSSTPIYTEAVLRPPVYEELFSIPNTTDTLHLTNISTFSNESATPPLAWFFSTATYGVSAPLLSRIFDITNETIYSFDEVAPWLFWDFAFEPLPTNFLAHTGGKHDSLGTSAADGNGMILLVSGLWPNSKDDAIVHAKVVELMAKIDGAAKEMGLLREFVYTNYAGWAQRPIQSYGRENVAFLRRVARKYDPRGVFQKRVPGGFKLP